LVCCSAVLVGALCADARAEEPDANPPAALAAVIGVHHADVPVVGLRYSHQLHARLGVTVNASTSFRLVDRLQIGLQLAAYELPGGFELYGFGRVGVLYQKDDGAGFDDTLAPLGTVGLGFARRFAARWELFADAGLDVIGPDYSGDNDRDWSWRVVGSGAFQAGVAVRF
jgi:hypothetical protein